MAKRINSPRPLHEAGAGGIWTPRCACVCFDVAEWCPSTWRGKDGGEVHISRTMDTLCTGFVV